MFSDSRLIAAFSSSIELIPSSLSLSSIRFAFSFTLNTSFLYKFVTDHLNSSWNTMHFNESQLFQVIQIISCCASAYMEVIRNLSYCWRIADIRNEADKIFVNLFFHFIHLTFPILAGASERFQRQFLSVRTLEVYMIQ